ncbi:uncharacterized protein YutE (UPF0331/DUF86 family) [Scopulibacillus daqui]|uniref:Uncharacterized protein YutE (UPF0331/DUF86 family) n=1 Tax=Scopulibacillus daqui TaxID=1469162 RepID=A0ABS2Q1J8_9BACL|nr:DUF86 domain-containing protein [Scopulibacillus daqui]MBM7646091.1 uncharacterized protein YutE (UPF0331/DUF86 family) [Scopulibacillus daqui]
MYFIDRRKIEATLAYMSQHINLFNEKTEWRSEVEKLALERLAQNVIEAFIDIGNHMIDGFIMRDPGSYEDIVDILVDEQVIPKDNEAGFKAIVQLRKALVSQYLTIDHDKLYTALKENQQVLKDFPRQVRHYLEQELGPVSAFMPENQE